MSFKLLAIRPLEGCNERFLKNLQAGEIYKFYSDYEFLNQRNEQVSLSEEVAKIIFKSTIPEDLYYINKNKETYIAVSISAIVGKNGSGKSSISELFLYALFVISNRLGFIDKSKFLELESTKQEDLIESKEYEKDVIDITSGLKIELYYLLENNFFKLCISGGKIYLSEYSPNLNNQSFSTPTPVTYREALGHFFYSMIVNYSFYGFNTNQIGNWIKAFFHKNDGYQMPVVINPFREKGNLDVNIENQLTRARLLANILSISNYKNINRKSAIDSIELFFDNRKDYKFLGNNELRFTHSFVQKFRELIIIPLYKLTFNESINYPEINTEIKKYAELYLIHKLITIPSRYKLFEDFNKRKRKKDDSQDNYNLTNKIANDYVEALHKDKSHITLKVRQTLNFLRQNLYNIPEGIDFKNGIEIKSAVRNINKAKSEKWFTETIDYLPPPFLTSRIKFKDGSYFDQLSSGEKQKIYSLNSVIYHMKNLESVHKNKLINKEKLIIEYDTVNLIFDEIELYYHPEFQKNTITDLLSLLRKANFKYIENINIVFLTHSPFILSDIPIQNIMLLNFDSKTGKSIQVKSRKQTFGANIHDLLADNFFLHDTFIGDFADKKIMGLIKNIKSKTTTKSDRKLLKLIGDTFLKTGIELYSKSNDKD